MSDSENGQIHSPGNNDERISAGGDDAGDTGGGADVELDYKDDDEERDADSLTIKPPQAIVSHSRDRELGRHGGGGRGKDKIRSKEKKHSKERRHKERSTLKEREREREQQQRGGRGGAEYMERYPPRGSYEDNHESRRGGYGSGGGGRHFEGGGGGARGNHHYHLQQQQSHYHHQQQQQHYHMQHMQQQQQRHHEYYERSAAAYHNNRQAYGGGGGGGKHYHDDMRGGMGGMGGGGKNQNERDRRNERSQHDMLLHERDGGDRDRESDRERRKYANLSNDKQPVKDAESLEQDLRSRLLSKRHKYVRGSGGSGGGGVGGNDHNDDDDRYDDDDDVVQYEKERERERSSKSSRRAEKKGRGNGNGDGGESGNVIELLDSPDANDFEDGEYKSSRRRHKSRKQQLLPPNLSATDEQLPPPPLNNINNSSSIEKRKTPDDPELLARRARFLAAEREKELRKESAREELHARRELLRERERKELSNANALSPSAVAASVTAGLNVIKRKSSGDPTATAASGTSAAVPNRSKRKRLDNEALQHSGDEQHVKSELSDDESDSYDDDDDDESDEDDSESHSDDSVEAASVKSVSPKMHRRLHSVNKQQQQQKHNNNSSGGHRKHNNKHKQRRNTISENEQSQESDEAEAKNAAQNYSDVEMADDVRNAYMKRKSKRKRRKNTPIDLEHANENDEDDDHDVNARASAAASVNDSEHSVSSIESEDSFYAKRKREKRLPKAAGGDHHGAAAATAAAEDDDDSSRERAYYKAAVKSKKSKRKTKTTTKAEHENDINDDDDDDDVSMASDGSVKARRARKRRSKHSSISGEEEDDDDDDDGAKSLSHSDNSELESDGGSFYKKKQRHEQQQLQQHQRHRRHHHHHQRKQRKSGVSEHDEVGRKAKRKSANVASDVSSETSEDEFENGLKNMVGSDNSEASNVDDDDVQKRRHAKRKRRASDDASQFMADINEEEISLARNEKDAVDAGHKHHHHHHHHQQQPQHQQNTRSSRGSGTMTTLTGNALETIYDDKGEPLPNYYPGIQGCRTVEEFQCLNRIEEGTYGVVYRARDQRTNEIVALKRLKMEKEREGFPITSLREINTLLKGQHPNIVTVREIVVGSNLDKIYIVMDYVEHDLKSLMETMKTRKQIFFPGEVKCLAQQLMRAVGHLHDNWILHRDLKTSNLLLSHKGILKVGDFGLAREYGSPLRKYTSLVVTRWYRAPELLLCSPMYSTPIDIWSVGCIFAEFLLMTPYLPGKSDIDQLNRIFKELGTPNEKIWPGYNELPAVKNVLSQNTQFADYPMSNLRKRFKDKVSEAGISLLQGLLTYDPKQRLTAESALDHVYFKELPLPIDPAMFPTWPAKSELGSTRSKTAAAHSPQPPSGGAQFKQLGQDDYAAIKTTTKVAGTGSGQTNNKVVSGIITGNKKSAANTGFVLNSGNEQRQLAMGPGFNLKF